MMENASLKAGSFVFIMVSRSQKRYAILGYCCLEILLGNTHTQIKLLKNLTMPINFASLTQTRHWRRSGVFLVNFQHISHCVLVF